MNERDRQRVDFARRVVCSDLTQDLIAIIDRLNDERIKQHDTIMNYRDEVGHLKKQLTEIRKGFTPRLAELFDGFYIIDDQCECEEGCGPECVNEDGCPCIAHEVHRLGQALKEE